MVSNENFDNIEKMQPIKGGASITFGNVIAQINKAIQTLINKFKSLDDELTNIHSDFIGVSNYFTLKVDNIKKGEKDNWVVIEIPTDRQYTHGTFVFNVNDKNMMGSFSLPNFWSNMVKKITYFASVNVNNRVHNLCEIWRDSEVCASGFCAFATSDSQKIKITLDLLGGVTYDDFLNSVKNNNNTYKILYELF